MKPVLLGMNNPLSADPAHALFPHPKGCAGHRLMTMSGLTRQEYMAQFERINLLNRRTWSRSQAEQEAVKLRPYLSGSTVVALGKDTQRALGLHVEKDICRVIVGDAVVYCVPHPSGRSRFYNEERNRRRVGRLLRSLAKGERQ